MIGRRRLVRTFPVCCPRCGRATPDRTTSGICAACKAEIVAGLAARNAAVRSELSPPAIELPEYEEGVSNEDDAPIYVPYEVLDPSYLDWPDRVAVETAIGRRLAALPTCVVCKSALTMGQRGAHFICLDPDFGRPVKSEIDAPAEWYAS